MDGIETKPQTTQEQIQVRNVINLSDKLFDVLEECRRVVIVNEVQVDSVLSHEEEAFSVLLAKDFILWIS